MSNQPKIYPYKTLSNLAARLRDDLNEHHFVLLYAHYLCFLLKKRK
jgi:hypothetical protein